MPLAVYILGLAIFAQGTSELMLAGLLPELAGDLDVSIPAAGLLISAFAVGMLVGAPVLAVVTLRWPRRTALLVFLAIFALTHVAAALTPNYAFLLATRVVGAFVYAGFWAVAAVTAVGLVPTEQPGEGDEHRRRWTHHRHHHRSAGRHRDRSAPRLAGRVLGSGGDVGRSRWPV